MNQSQNSWSFPGLTNPPVFSNAPKNLHDYPQAGGGYLRDTFNSVGHGQHRDSGVGYAANSNVVNNRADEGPQAQTGRREEVVRGIADHVQMGEMYHFPGREGMPFPDFPQQKAPSFFQAGPTQQRALGYASVFNAADQAFRRQATTITSGPYNGHAAVQAGLSESTHQQRQYHGNTIMNENNTRTPFHRPLPSHLQQMANQPMHNTVGYRVGDHHGFRYGQQPQPRMRYAPYPRRMIQPSTATSFVGARSYGSVPAQHESALDMQGFTGGHAIAYPDAANPRFSPQQAIPETYPNCMDNGPSYADQYQPDYPPQYAPQHPSSSPTFYPSQQIGYNLGQSQPPRIQAFQEHQSPNTATTAWRPHWSNGDHLAPNGFFENQGAMRQAPGSQGQFVPFRAPQMQVYESHTQFDVSDSSYGGSEKQNHVFGQSTGTGNLASSGHHPVERFQFPIGPTSQSSLVPSGNHEQDIQVPEEDISIEDHTITSGGIEGTAYPASTSEEQEMRTHQQFELHDYNLNGPVIHSVSVHPDEQENPKQNSGSQSNHGKVQQLGQVPSTVTQVPLPSPDEEDRGDNENNGQGGEDQVDESEDNEEEDEDEDMEEDEKTVMCKMAIQPGWFAYVFLRPSNNLFAYHR